MLLDKPELLVQTGLHPIGNRAVAPYRRLAAEALQIGIRGEVLCDRVIGEAVVEVCGQVEAALPGELHCVAQGFGAVPKKEGHLRRRFQIELGVGPALAVGLLQALAVFYSHQGILKLVAFPDVIVDVVGGYYTYAQLAGKRDELPVAAGIAVDQVLL